MLGAMESTPHVLSDVHVLLRNNTFRRNHGSTSGGGNAAFCAAVGVCENCSILALRNSVTDSAACASRWCSLTLACLWQSEL